MSYDVYIYHVDVARTVRGGTELDEFDHPSIRSEDMARLLERLIKYGYREEQSGGSSREFIKEIAGCPIQVSVFPSEIAFSVPYWDNSEPALVEALQDATELADSETTAFYDPQSEEWAE